MVRPGSSDNPIDPLVFGLAKAAYGVGENLTCLVSVALRSTQRSNEVTSNALSSARTLFYATDLASFLTRLRRFSETNAQRLGRGPTASKDTEHG